MLLGRKIDFVYKRTLKILEQTIRVCITSGILNNSGVVKSQH